MCCNGMVKFSIIATIATLPFNANGATGGHIYTSKTGEDQLLTSMKMYSTSFRPVKSTPQNSFFCYWDDLLDVLVGVHGVTHTYSYV